MLDPRHLLLTAATALPLAAAGCAHDQYDHRHDRVVREERVVVVEEPPRERVEVIGVPPSRDHVYVKGHWVRRGRDWDWSPGHWVVRPRHNAQYVPGHWERERGGWVYVEGHWR